jgi:hypothetical protein
MIRRAKLYARIAADGQYSRVAVAYDRKGRPIEAETKDRPRHHLPDSRSREIH